MSRFATAGFAHETNTFSFIPTTWESFATKKGPLTGIITTEEILSYKGIRANFGTSGFFAVQDALGHEVFPILITATEPSNQIPRKVFLRIVKMITDGIQANGPFDGIYLDLHGAMVYEGYNDGETEILRQVRATVGNIPIVTSYDLHGNITRQCFEIADAMVGCRTYPHVDMYETGERCAHLMNHILEGKPIFKAYSPLPFLIPVSTMSTMVEPAKSLYVLIDEVEKEPSVLSATIMEGFQAADIPEMGPTLFAYATSQTAADRAVKTLYDAFLAREGQFRSDLPDAEQAVQQALQQVGKVTGPVILADVQDNAGGGASSDTTGILRSLILHHAQKAALALMYDPAAAEQAYAAGEGAQIELDLGGKLTPGDQPVHGVFHVEKLFDGEFEGSSPVNRGVPISLGKMAQLRLDGIRIVVSSVRTQANDQMFFRVVGIEPKDMDIIVVKSSNHFRADFEPISGAIISVAAPGQCLENPIHIPYKNLREGLRLQGLGPVYKRPVK
jgi:microcystin degradation protein MlrC